MARAAQVAQQNDLSTTAFKPITKYLSLQALGYRMAGEQEKRQKHYKSAFKKSLAVLGEDHRFQQVLINLITNSLDAMRHQTRSKEITIELSEKNGIAQLNYWDTGPGIKEAFIPKIFSPFATTKKEGEGTGLGMAIAKDIITELLGSIEYASDSEGAHFIIKLPLIAGGTQQPSSSVA